ncbi:MAG TPA: DUF3653 domain-containing protein [Povalibacter sp.]|uniref:DUF3653 domain-containing protein n=1 Tax=Povalibacter sp. TaxID=1962978 RepID=UPI002BAA048D|nr:DUF3653 domain-containing protein [Povalibacter sp.]HMN47469.1 DUF3653 domain-containing protein [Povalibacter sp.]
MDLSTYGLSVMLLSQLTGVHPDTARRWKRAGKVPAHYAQLLALRLGGDLGSITGSWSGFKLDSGQLWTPEGRSVTTGDIRAIPYTRELVHELQKQLAEPQQWKLF